MYICKKFKGKERGTWSSSPPMPQTPDELRNLKIKIIMSSSVIGIILGTVYAIISIALIIRAKKLYLRVPLALIAVLAIVFSYVSQSNFATLTFLICFGIEAIILACTIDSGILKTVLWIVAIIVLIIPAMMLFTKGVDVCFDFLLHHKGLSFFVGLTIATSFLGTKFLSGTGGAPAGSSSGSHTVEGGGMRSFKTRDEAEKWAEQNDIDKSKVH